MAEDVWKNCRSPGVLIVFAVRFTPALVRCNASRSIVFFFSSRRRHTRSVSAFLLNRSSDLIAGIQSATSRQNTKDQVYAQNEMLAYQQKESTARVASIMENTNLSKQQQVSEIMRQMLTQAQTAGQYFTNDQIKEMTR